MAKIIFVAGLDTSKSDLKLDAQAQNLKSGFPKESVPESIDFRYEVSPADVKAAIDANLGVPIVLFSAGCSMAGDIAKHLVEKGQSLNLLHINEPYTVSNGGTKQGILSAIKLGVPAKNVYSGGTNATGSNIPGATKLNGRKSHFQSLVALGKYLYETVEYFKNPEAKPEEEKKDESVADKKDESVDKNDESSSGTQEQTNEVSKDVNAGKKHIPFVEGLTDSVETVTDENFNVSEKASFSFQIQAKTDLPDFKIYVGNPDEWGVLDPVDADQTLDDTGELDEYTEEPFFAEDMDLNEIVSYESPEIKRETEENAAKVNSLPRGETYGGYVKGKHVLDMLPGTFLNNDKVALSCCQIDKKPVNVAIADAYLDMKEAMANAGIVGLAISSAFRPAFGKGISTKSESGVKVSAQSQEEVWVDNCGAKYPNGKCGTETAAPGGSKHGSGIALDLNTGTKYGNKKKFGELNKEMYTWLCKNSWKYGFIRAVPSEEWHFEYWPDKAKNGPYAKVASQGFHAELGLKGMKLNKDTGEWG